MKTTETSIRTVLVPQVEFLEKLGIKRFPGEEMHILKYGLEEGTQIEIEFQKEILK